MQLPRRDRHDASANLGAAFAHNSAMVDFPLHTAPIWHLSLFDCGLTFGADDEKNE
jgi:hypothetical protein